MKSLAYSVKATHFSDEYLEVQSLLHEKIYEYLAKAVPQEGAFEGSFAHPYERVLWKVTIKDLYQESEAQEKIDFDSQSSSTNVADLEDEIKIHFISIDAIAKWSSKSTPHQLIYSTKQTIVEIPEDEITGDDDERIQLKSDDSDEEDEEEA